MIEVIQERMHRDRGAVRRALLLLSMAVLGGSTALEAAAREAPLDGDRVRTLIVGNTVTGPLDAKPYDFSYSADGSVVGSAGGSTDSGRWKIRDDGAYCHEWSTYFGGDERCYQWFDRGNGRYLLKNVDTFRVRDLEVWKIRPGLD